MPVALANKTSIAILPALAVVATGEALLCSVSANHSVCSPLFVFFSIEWRTISTHQPLKHYP